MVSLVVRRQGLTVEVAHVRALQATRLSWMTGRCLRPAWKLTTSDTFRPGAPSMSAAGAAHGALQGQLDLGSMRGAWFAAGRSWYTSLGVLPSR